MDLNNLTDDLKYGVLKETAKSTMYLTPLARLSFTKLDEAEAFRGGRPKYSVNLIFETDPAKEGAVDLTKVFLPKVLNLAKANGVKAEKLDGGIAFGSGNDQNTP